MSIDRAGWPFVLGAAVPAALAAWAGSAAIAAVLLGVAGLFLFFFRDPDRQSPDDPALVLSPADGRVLIVGQAQPDVSPPGTWLQISVFLSPLDVHVNRVPVSGTVTTVTFRRGRYLPAYRPDAASANERSEVWVERGGHPVVFRQIVGMLARRVVCRLQPGRQVVAGERFGVMKFGSRMDVFLPPDSQTCVSPGDRVKAGVTVLARLPAGPPSTR